MVSGRSERSLVRACLPLFVARQLLRWVLHILGEFFKSALSSSSWRFRWSPSKFLIVRRFIWRLGFAVRDWDVFTEDLYVFVEGPFFSGSLGEWLILKMLFVVLKLFLHHLPRVVEVISHMSWERFETGPL